MPVLKCPMKRNLRFRANLVPRSGLWGSVALCPCSAISVTALEMAACPLSCQGWQWFCRAWLATQLWVSPRGSDTHTGSLRRKYV